MDKRQYFFEFSCVKKLYDEDFINLMKGDKISRRELEILRFFC